MVLILRHFQMSVQELSQNSTISDLLKRACRCNAQLRLRLNCSVTHNWNQGPKMGDVLELIPSTRCKSGGYMRAFHQMFDRHLAISQS
jgi:GTP pyrophosphokinase